MSGWLRRQRIKPLTASSILTGGNFIFRWKHFQAILHKTVKFILFAKELSIGARNIATKMRLFLKFVLWTENFGWILIDNYYKTIFESVGSACFSYMVWVRDVRFPDALLQFVARFTQIDKIILRKSIARTDIEEHFIPIDNCAWKQISKGIP